MFTKKISVDPGKLYSPIGAFVSKHGSFTVDQRLAGDNPAVIANPELFLATDLSSAEEQQIIAARGMGRIPRFSQNH